MKRMKLIVYGFLLIFMICSNIAFAAMKYRISDLGTLDTSTSYATSINNKGQVCGTYYDIVKKKIFVFLWDPHNGLRKLGIQALHYNHIFINNNGQVAGTYTNDSHYGRTFTWDPSSGFLDLNLKMTNLQVVDFNDLGQILIRTNTLDSLFCWDNGLLNKIILDNVTSYWNFRINNSSEVFGEIVILNEKKLGQHGACHFSIQNNVPRNLKLVELKGNAYIGNINEQGYAVGSVSTKNSTRGFVWHTHFGINFTPGFIPQCINSEGIMIGKNEASRLSIWDRGIITDLIESLDLDNDMSTNWESIDQVYDFNDLGQIVGVGTINNQTHAFLLTPVDN